MRLFEINFDLKMAQSIKIRVPSCFFIFNSRENVKQPWVFFWYKIQFIFLSHKIVIVFEIFIFHSKKPFYGLLVKVTKRDFFFQKTLVVLYTGVDNVTHYLKIWNLKNVWYCVCFTKLLSGHVIFCQTRRKFSFTFHWIAWTCPYIYYAYVCMFIHKGFILLREKDKHFFMGRK